MFDREKKKERKKKKKEKKRKSPGNWRAKKKSAIKAHRATTIKGVQYYTIPSLYRISTLLPYWLANFTILTGMMRGEREGKCNFGGNRRGG